MTPLRLATESTASAPDHGSKQEATAAAWLGVLVDAGEVAALSASAVRMSLVLAHHGRLAGVSDAWPSATRLGELCGLGRAATFKALGELEGRGLIERAAPADGRSTTAYKLTKPKSEILGRVGGRVGGQVERAGNGAGAERAGRKPARSQTPDPPGEPPPLIHRSTNVDPPSFTGPQKWTPPSTDVDPPVQKRGLCSASSAKAQQNNNTPQSKTKTTAAANSGTERQEVSGSAGADRFAAAALLMREGFEAADAGWLASNAAIETSVQDAVANADYLASKGTLRSRRGYIRSAVLGGWPLIPEIASEREKAAEAQTKRTQSAGRLLAASSAWLTFDEKSWLSGEYSTPGCVIEAGFVTPDEVFDAFRRRSDYAEVAELLRRKIRESTTQRGPHQRLP